MLFVLFDTSVYVVLLCDSNNQMHSGYRAVSPREHPLSPRHESHQYAHAPLPTDHLPHCYHANCCQGLLTACDVYGVACQHAVVDDDSSESPRTQDSGFEGLSSRHDVSSVHQGELKTLVHS